MFRVVPSPIIRCENNCIYSIWYLSHCYCYLPLSRKRWNWFECAVGGVRNDVCEGTVTNLAIVRTFDIADIWNRICVFVVSAWHCKSKSGLNSNNNNNNNKNQFCVLILCSKRKNICNAPWAQLICNNTRFVSLFMVCSGPGSAVGIATSYGLDGPWIKSRWGGEIFRTCPDRPWGPPSLLYNGYQVFPGGKERPGRNADPLPLSSAVVMKE